MPGFPAGVTERDYTRGTQLYVDAAGRRGNVNIVLPGHEGAAMGNILGAITNLSNAALIKSGAGAFSDIPIPLGVAFDEAFAGVDTVAVMRFLLPSLQNDIIYIEIPAVDMSALDVDQNYQALDPANTNVAAIITNVATFDADAVYLGSYLTTRQKKSRRVLSRPDLAEPESPLLPGDEPAIGGDEEV